MRILSFGRQDQHGEPGAFATFEDTIALAASGGCAVEPREVQVEATVRRALAQRAGQTATLTINFEPDFPDIARPAVLRAAEIWGGLLASPVEIIIGATWFAGPPGLLGLCLPNEVRDFQRAPVAGTLYPLALANRIAGGRVSSGSDMEILFNADEDAWYYGLDAKPRPTQFELLTVALHEIGHGIGHYGSLLALDIGQPPRVFDRFVAGRLGQRMLDYEPVSRAMTDELVLGGNFAGPNARAVALTGSQSLRLHPSGHRYGTAFCDNRPQNLMGTPYNPGTIGRPDDVLLAMLRDLGWGTAPTASPVFRRTTTPIVTRD
ncbi:MAG: hypothetical protein ACKVT1_13115 [Dehalococcoidia bacterium]